jgi:hypothetical protein
MLMCIKQCLGLLKQMMGLKLVGWLKQQRELVLMMVMWQECLLGFMMMGLSLG